jgi:hypothetical protein
MISTVFSLTVNWLNLPAMASLKTGCRSYDLFDGQRLASLSFVTVSTQKEIKALLCFSDLRKD